MLGSLSPLEERLNVLRIEIAQVEVCPGASLRGDGDPIGDGTNGRRSVVLHRSHSEVGREHDDQEAVFIDIHHQGGVALPLLVHAREVAFVHQARHELHRVVGVRAKCREGSGVDLFRIAALVDEVSGFLDEERDVGLALLEQLAKHNVDVVDVVLIQLWKLAHKGGSSGKVLGLPGSAYAVVEEFMEKHARDHVEGLENPFALRS